MTEIITSNVTASQIGAFLVALRRKGETVEELTAFAKVMLDHSVRIQPRIGGTLVDTCGTGGDKIKTFNVSTVTALVVSACGVPVAKHGNRSFTSKCGSADVFERLGLNLDLEPERVQECIEQIGIGFMYAPRFHPAMRTVAAIRKEIGIRTVFNILGPLTNPARANVQLIGVSDLQFLEIMAKAAIRLGAKSVMTVHGLDGFDEISLTGTNAIFRAAGDVFTSMEIEPEDIGLKRILPREITGSDPHTNARIIYRILSGKAPDDDPHVQTVLANTAAVLVISERANDFREGIEIANGVIKDGLGLRTLQDLVEFSGGDGQLLKHLA